MTNPDPAPAELTEAAVRSPGLRGTVRIIGGPGTGKSGLLVDAAAAHIAGGVDLSTVGSAVIAAVVYAVAGIGLGHRSEQLPVGQPLDAAVVAISPEVARYT